MHLITIIYNLAVSCWLGGAALFTFRLTPLIFASYSRDIAGGIVSILFPGYFRWGLICGAVALLCQIINRGRFAIASLMIITIMLALTTVQAFVFEPRAAALKQAIVSFETTPPDDPQRVQFRNLTVIVGGIVLVILSSLPVPSTAGREPEPGKIVAHTPTQAQ
jgi:hypothetical protein